MVLKDAEIFLRTLADSLRRGWRSDASRLGARRLLRQWVRECIDLQLRWSFFAIVGLVVLGAVVNRLIPHGWAVWPFVAAAGMMLMIHEAADRNGQGIP